MISARDAAGSHSAAWPTTTRLDRFLGRLLQQQVEPAGIEIRLWDGAPCAALTEKMVGALGINDRRTLIGLLLNADLQFGESYTTGRLEVVGALEPVLEALSRVQPPQPSWFDHLRATVARSISIDGARRNIHEHYDLGNDFYARWLDREMLYTCAYYPTRDTTLDAAQHAKLVRVCSKLRLRPSDSVIEAGSGWGALALFMARQYGVHVRSFNLSGEQVAYARERAAREGLDHRVEFIEDDYRNVTGKYDVFVSLGMLEHVGLRQFPALAQVLERTVRRRGGRGLLHFIGRDAPRPVNAWIRRHIFPGSYTPTLAEVTAHVLTPAGMSVLDVENLRLHYVQTLRQWRERFMVHRSEFEREFSHEFVRAWDLYLAGSQAAFATGWMQLFQLVFAPRGTSPPYWTRG